jgi:hypothetical protein
MVELLNQAVLVMPNPYKNKDISPFDRFAQAE